MRKILALMLSALLMLSLTACGGKTDGGKTGDGGTSVASPSPGAAAADSLTGEWISRDADLYLMLFGDGTCIFARSGNASTGTGAVNAADSYSAADGSLTLTGGRVSLGAYSISNDVMTLKVDGTDYTFTRPDRAVWESGDYSSAPSAADYISYAAQMEKVLGDTLASFDGDQQVYDTPIFSFSVPASAGREASPSGSNNDEKVKIDFYGGDVEITVQANAHIRRGSTPEDLTAEFAADYPGAEIDTAAEGPNGEYVFARRDLPGGDPGYLLGKVFVQESGEQGYTSFTIEVRAQNDGVTGREAWDDPFVQSILDTLTFHFA